jgi:hypothetical protein
VCSSVDESNRTILYSTRNKFRNLATQLTLRTKKRKRSENLKDQNQQESNAKKHKTSKPKNPISLKKKERRRLRRLGLRNNNNNNDNNNNNNNNNNDNNSNNNNNNNNINNNDDQNESGSEPPKKEQCHNCESVVDSHFIENPSSQFPNEFVHSETKMQQISSSMVPTLQTNSQTQDRNEAVLIVIDSRFLFCQ